MSSFSSLVKLVGIVEPLLLVIAIVLLWRAKEYKRFPALSVYLGLRLVCDGMLSFLLLLRTFLPLSEKTAYAIYFWSYWPSYILGSIAVLFVLHELFRGAMKPLPELKHVGSLVFRWVATISMIAAITPLTVSGQTNQGYNLLFAVCRQTMLCESIFTLCLLLFLMLAASKLGLSYQSRIFNICFGFGLLATSNLVSSMFAVESRNIWSSRLGMMDTVITLAAICIWSISFLREDVAGVPAPASKLSPLARWNEIAASFGHSSLGRPSTASASSEFFLKDVEKVVDRVLVKNSLHMTG